MNVSVERAQGHQNAIYSIKICAKAKTELADISQNCFHEARIVLLQTELFSKIHLLKATEIELNFKFANKFFHVF